MRPVAYDCTVPPVQSMPERRAKKRIALQQCLLARFGTVGAVVLDITDAGARIEHLERLYLRKESPFRFEWKQRTIEATAEVKSCSVHHFVAGDQGATVYQSGLHFTAYAGDSHERMHDFISATVARSLAEQLANARGVERPIAPYPSPAKIPDRGFLRCTLVGGSHFDRKWSRTPDQPPDGFTISAAEPPDQVEQLCVTYLTGDEQQRRLIREMARMSVDRVSESI